MKKIVLRMDQIVQSYNAIDHLLSFQGITRKKVYWLHRNKQNMEKYVDKWYNEHLKALFDKMAVSIDSSPFVPIADYQAFKRELTDTFMDDHVFDFKLLPIFEKYEKKSEAQIGIPVEKKKEYQKAVNDLITSLEFEIEYETVEADAQFDSIMQNLSGDEQVALEFMLIEPSEIKIVPGGTIIQ
jgi:hypothetical protein